MHAPHSPLSGYYGEERDRAGWVKSGFTFRPYPRLTMTGSERAMALKRQLGGTGGTRWLVPGSSRG